MQTFLFYLFSSVLLLSSLLVILCRNTVNSAMYMIVSFVSMAGLFVLLQAYFLAVLQVLVYAGAVMVLFVFIIMLLDVERFSSQMPSKLSLAASTTALFIVVTSAVHWMAPSNDLPSVQPMTVTAMPADASHLFAFCTSAKAFGYALFTKYMLPFQMVGVLLLASMIGVVVISKQYHPQSNN